MTKLPPSVTAVAFEASNGELAWAEADIENAILGIRDAGLAILGGEVWRIVGPHTWHGLIPDKAGGLPGVWGWDTDDRREHEGWLAYCERTAASSVAAVRDIALNMREEVPSDILKSLSFNVTYIDQSELDALVSSRS